jgi:DNA-binding LacI/PurR family transcriptional regulator
MREMRRLSVVEQSANHLRNGIRNGLWRGTLPGLVPLARELNISRGTLQSALRILENEKLVSVHGAGNSRSINLRKLKKMKLRVGVLRFEEEGLQMSKLLFQVQHNLEARGHRLFFAPKSQNMLQHSLARIVRHVAESPADAWIVEAGSRELLEWFSQQPVPCFALYGRSEGLPLSRSGPEMIPPLLEVTRELIALGHRRIVTICRRDRREPTLGNAERAILDTLSDHGIVTGEYNMPDWEMTPVGLESMLKKMFRATPPTALILDESYFAINAAQFLARNGIDVPGKVSLFSTQYDEALAWCRPVIAHIQWKSEPVVRRLTRWVDDLQKGRNDRKTINFPAEYVRTDSIGPAWKG